MSSGSRIALGVVAVAVVVAVFLILRPSDDPTVSPATTAAETSTEAAPPDEKSQQPEPAVTKIDVVGGEPKGGVTDIDVKAGDQVEFEVTADAPEEVHVHGYDLSEEVGPGQKAAFDFDADLEGVYEVELENSAVQIAELRVNP